MRRADFEPPDESIPRRTRADSAGIVIVRDRGAGGGEDWNACANAVELGQGQKRWRIVVRDVGRGFSWEYPENELLVAQPSAEEVERTLDACMLAHRDEARIPWPWEPGLARRASTGPSTAHRRPLPP